MRCCRPDYPPLRYLAQLDQDGYFSSLHTRPKEGEVPQLTLTFEDLLRRTPFAETMRDILHILEENYHAPVDVEFTAHLANLGSPRPEVNIAIVQCRPQSYLQEIDRVRIPANLDPDQHRLFDPFHGSPGEHSARSATWYSCRRRDTSPSRPA